MADEELFEAVSVFMSKVMTVKDVAVRLYDMRGPGGRGRGKEGPDGIRKRLSPPRV